MTIKALFRRKDTLVVDLTKIGEFCLFNSQILFPHPNRYRKNNDVVLQPETEVIFVRGQMTVGIGSVSGALNLYTGKSDFEDFIAITPIGWHVEPTKNPELFSHPIRPLSRSVSLILPLSRQQRMKPALSLPWSPRKAVGSSSWCLDQRKQIHADMEITLEEKLSLFEALDDAGEFREKVIDLHDEVLLYEYEELEICPIIPWASACNDIRLDPHNYVLLPSAVAENFRGGLLTFGDRGCMEFASSMIKNPMDLGIDWNYELLSLSDRQQEYLGFHRQHVFGAWLADHQVQIHGFPFASIPFPDFAQ